MKGLSIPGQPGMPGAPGIDGQPGRQGSKGERGEPGYARFRLVPSSTRIHNHYLPIPISFDENIFISCFVPGEHNSDINCFSERI